MAAKLSKYLLSVLVVLGFLSSPVSAHQSPIGCNSNRLNLSITRDKVIVKQGETLNYTVTASNLDVGPSIACDIDNVTIVVTLPNLDGTSTGQIITLANAVTFTAGMPVTNMGTVPYVVNVNDGVTDVIAEVEINGVLHDAPVNHSAQISKTIGTTVVYDAKELPDDVLGDNFSRSLLSPVRTILLPGMPNTATSRI